LLLGRYNNGMPRAAKRQKERSLSARKDRILEQIVGWLYEADDVLVEERVKLPTLHNDTDRREIDVLLTVKNSVYPVRFAIECKNEHKAIDSPYIDAFAGKLQAIGIPPQCGILIATSRFTAEATRYAKRVGIRTLLLSGLSKDRLLSEITRAAQSIVYLVPIMTRVEVRNDFPAVAHAGDLYALYDEEGQYRGTVLDLVWWLWRIGHIPARVGEHDMDVPLPGRCHNMIGGAPYHIDGVGVTVKIVGLVVTFVGQGRRHALSRSDDGTIDKFKLHVDFDVTQAPSTLRSFETEDDLRVYIEGTGQFRLIQRVMVPRITFEMAYWPPSARVLQLVADRMQAYEAGNIPDPRPFDFAELEGHDISVAWEPIADNYVVAMT